MARVGPDAELGGVAPSSTNAPGAHLDASKASGPEDAQRASAGVRHREVPHNLSRRAIHKKTPQSGVFLWMACVGSDAELGGVAPSSTKSPGAILDASKASGPAGRPQVGRKGAGQDARHNLSRRAIHKKTPQSGVFLWMARVGPDAELGGVAPSSTNAPGGRSPGRRTGTSMRYAAPAHPCALRIWTRAKRAAPRTPKGRPQGCGTGKCRTISPARDTLRLQLWSGQARNCSAVWSALLHEPDKADCPHLWINDARSGT